jgi:hypothetical protein
VTGDFITRPSCHGSQEPYPVSLRVGLIPLLPARQGWQLEGDVMTRRVQEGSLRLGVVVALDRALPRDVTTLPAPLAGAPRRAIGTWGSHGERLLVRGRTSASSASRARACGSPLRRAAAGVDVHATR